MRSHAHFREEMPFTDPSTLGFWEQLPGQSTGARKGRRGRDTWEKEAAASCVPVRSLKLILQALWRFLSPE